ncbi:hypothetical protein UUU_07740 [Klebsiella pneumoniae subsp. pneumoniae DSM 30104 = JCM 1662 = NBRC 14940]|nr:hypothetical protein UUU_07740 [Klebsiella pneumoniae subsp. pneumoniae DSM 30104 = JCM 1662 = NBRC 14940]
MADDRQVGNMFGERHQHRQEGDQGHHRVDKAHAHIFEGGSKTHGIFLHTLRGTFDMAQMLPVGHIVLVHRRAPAEDVVADEEVVHHANNHRDDRDAEKDADFLIKLIDADLMRGGQRALDQVVERRIPGVDRHPDFHQKPGDEDDERGAENRPVLPAVRAVDKPEQRKHADAKQIVSVEHQIVERPEARRADRHILRCPGDPQQPVAAARLPKDHGQQRPDKGRNKKRPRFGEKRFKHHCLLLTSYRSAIAVYDAYVGRRVDEPSRDRRMIRPDINSLVLLPCMQNCFCGFHL